MYTYIHMHAHRNMYTASHGSSPRVWITVATCYASCRAPSRRISKFCPMRYHRLHVDIKAYFPYEKFTWLVETRVAQNKIAKLILN